MMVLIIKKIPDLVQGLLAGSPSLGGIDMKSIVVSGARGAAMVAGAHVAAASGEGGGVMSGLKSGNMAAMKAGMSNVGGGMAGAAGLKGVETAASGMAGTFSGLAKAGGRAAAHNNPVSKGYQSGYKMAVGQDANSGASESGGGSNGQNAGENGGSNGGNGGGTPNVSADKAAKVSDMIENQNPYNK